MTKTNANYFRKTLAKNDVWIAPLAGVTDTAFRRICAEYGAELMTTEMVSAKGLFYNNRATKELLTLFDGERNTGVQIFGSDPKAIAEAIRRHLNQTQFAFIDINMGCPYKQSFPTGGTALLADGRNFFRVANATVEHLKTVTQIIIESTANISMLENVRIWKMRAFSHAIHDNQGSMYAGKADWDTIARVVDMHRSDYRKRR
jgi:tRNA-dihydrouridine synthase